MTDKQKELIQLYMNEDESERYIFESIGGLKNEMFCELILDSLSFKLWLIQKHIKDILTKIFKWKRS